MSEESGSFALVIGGGSGIGAALAARYRAAGITAVVWDIDGEHDVTCDVAEPDRVDEAVGVTTLRWGVPSWVTVTAGVGHFGTLLDADARRLRPGHPRERPGPVAVHAGVGPSHARSERSGLLCRRLERERQAGRPRHGHVLRIEGGALHAGQGGSGGVGPSRAAGERRGARGHPHPHARSRPGGDGRRLPLAGRRGEPDGPRPPRRGRRRGRNGRRAPRHGLGHRAGARVRRRALAAQPDRLARRLGGAPGTPARG